MVTLTLLVQGGSVAQHPQTQDPGEGIGSVVVPAARDEASGPEAPAASGAEAAPAASGPEAPAASGPTPPPGAGPDWTPPSWDDVVRDHGARVYRLAYRLTGNRHDAEDLTQEVFVRVFRSLERYTPGTFEGWLHRITTNLFLDGVRRKARIRFDGFADDAHDRLPGRERSPAEQHADGMLDGDIQAALDALSPEFRAAVVLCDIEGLSYEEVAEALDIKIGTVRSRIHRGRSQLREALAHRAPRSGTATRMPVGAAAAPEAQAHVLGQVAP